MSFRDLRMVNFRFCLFPALACHILTVSCQFLTNPGVENADPGCRASGYPLFGSTIYISLDDPSSTTFQYLSQGTCTSNSYSLITLQVEGNTYNCGYYANDGNYKDVSCPYPAGAGIAGVYTVNIGSIGYDVYTVTHVQQV